MKIKSCFFLVILSGIVVLNLFPQNNSNKDPFLGVWFAESGGEKFVQIYIDGIVFQIFDDGVDGDVYKYTISGDSLIINDGTDVFKFTVVDNNKINLTANGASIVLVKQSGPDIKKKISDLFEWSN